MKKLLIISPYFPPSNAADMQRIRMSLPHFKEFEWDAEVVTVDPAHSDMTKDELLLTNIPSEIKIHQVQAFEKKWTSKLGLGSIALRSLWFYKKYVDSLLEKQHFDLIYFSTTQFPVMVLGNHWKKKYHIPYVIDMQDPWHSEYYQDKPKSERPPKYWFSYRLNKCLEPIAMRNVSGLISVSQGYIDTLLASYPHLKYIPNKVITFGAFQPDFDFVNANTKLFNLTFQKQYSLIDIVYVGRGGYDMRKAASLLFAAFGRGLNAEPRHFERLRFHFIGTSYASKGQGFASIKPVADEMGLGKFVNEQTDRIPYYEGINCLTQADALVILGSDDCNYTASKLYLYILADKPLLAILHPNSSANTIIKTCNSGKSVSLVEEENTMDEIYNELLSFITKGKVRNTDWEAFKVYDARNMTKSQCELFNEIVN